MNPNDEARARKVSKEELVRMGRADPHHFDEVEGRWMSEAEYEGDVEEGPTMNPDDIDHDAVVQRLSYENGRSHERARIVAWLRQRVALLESNPDDPTAWDAAAALQVAAALIEESQPPDVA